MNGESHSSLVEVVEPGDGKNSRSGKIRGRLLETVGVYYSGEEVTIDAWRAVPVKCIKKPRRGEAFLRVGTNFEWVKP